MSHLNLRGPKKKVLGDGRRRQDWVNYRVSEDQTHEGDSRKTRRAAFEHVSVTGHTLARDPTIRPRSAKDFRARADFLSRQNERLIFMRREIKAQELSAMHKARSTMRKERSTPSDATLEARFDELGNPNRSLSPEGDGVWDTLLSPITPEPQPPSVGTSFASASRSTSPAPGQLWTQHKDVIRRIYMTEKMNLKQVKDYMEENHGFPPNLRLDDYEVAVRDLLKIRKNLRNQEWRIIGEQITSRQAQGKETEVVWNNRLIDPKKVHREVRRHLAVVRHRYSNHAKATLPETLPANLILRTPQRSPLLLTASIPSPRSSSLEGKSLHPYPDEVRVTGQLNTSRLGQSSSNAGSYWYQRSPG